MHSLVHPARHGLRRTVLAVACAAAMLATAVPAAWTQTEQKLADTKEQLGDAKEGLAEVAQQARSATSSLQEADAALAARRAELVAMRDDLEAARAAEEAAKAAVLAGIRDAFRAVQSVDRAQARISTRADLLDARVRQAYKYGKARTAEMLLRSDDPTELVTGRELIERVVDTERDVLDGLAALQADLEASRAIAEERAAALERAKAEAADAAARVAAAVAAQEQLTELVAEERAARATLLAELEADEAAHRRLVADLEAESKRLEKELAASRWRAGAPRKGEFVWPTTGRVGSGFGYRRHPIHRTTRLHAGIDIAAPTGQTIVATAAGKVISSGWRGGYGNTVVIDHGGGISSLSAHMSRRSVRTGQVVRAGQKIGEIGSTGLSTGPHLHFEIRKNGSPRNPLNYL